MPTSPYLTKWKLDHEDDWEELLDDASAYGTLFHTMIYEWFANKIIPKDMIEAARILAIRNGGGADMVEKNILSFLKFVEDYNVRPVLIEAMLLSEPIEHKGTTNQYAMTLDLLCYIDVVEETIVERQDGIYQRGKNKGQPRMVKEKTKMPVTHTALIDWKSNFFDKQQKSFYKSHQYQLIACKRAVENAYPDIHVDFVYNFAPTGWKTKVNYTLQQWDITELDNEKFDAYIHIGLLEGYFRPSGKIFVPPIFQEGVKSDSFQMLGYEEFVKANYLDNAIETTATPVPPEFLDSDILSYVDMINELT